MNTVALSSLTTSIVQSLGLNIRAERSRRGLSQEMLAEASGLHRTYIGVVERGEKNITVCSCKKIASALNLSLSSLIRMAEESSLEDKE
ncbi:MAG: helix-turn-helix transcriptional regulator [Candidatus Chlorobium antarcticum]|nr:helix-turn-helix transcriptional regulator [Candidatus Chlorobium antarcticum]